MERKQVEKCLFDAYVREVRIGKQNKLEPMALHLYSKRVYRAYHNAWKLIDRRLLTSDEIEIMKQLGCYKPSTTELGTRWCPPEHLALLRRWVPGW